ncbi:MAG: hypothetical protein AAF290_11410 [Pseudomonadota bacterium]
MTVNSENGKSNDVSALEDTMLDDAYAALPPVQSPSDLDARILSAAHAAVEAPVSRTDNRWLPRLGLAAAIVLAVGATLKMQTATIEPASDVVSTVPRDASDQQVALSESSLAVEPVGAESEIVEFRRSPTGIGVIEAEPAGPMAAQPAEAADLVAIADDNTANRPLAKAAAEAELLRQPEAGSRFRRQQREEFSADPNDKARLTVSVEQIKGLLADQNVSEARDQWQRLQASTPETDWDAYFTPSELAVLIVEDDD